MNFSKTVGIIILSIGVLVLLYKDVSSNGFGGDIDRSWENIILSLILILIGFIWIKKSKK